MVRGQECTGDGRANKCARALCYILNALQILAIFEGQARTGTVQQQVSCLLCQPSRGHQVDPVVMGGTATPRMGFPFFSSVRAMYLPGPQNMPADFLSCRKPPSVEWRLHSEVVEAIWSKYGTAEVDLFAS